MSNIQKVYSVRVDNEVDGKYSNEVSKFNVLANDFEEALDKATAKVKEMSETNVVGVIEMLNVIA